MFLCYDTEASGLLTKEDLYLHCIVAIDEAFNMFIYVDHKHIETIKKAFNTSNVFEFNEFNNLVKNYRALICHNQIRYDLPLLEKLIGLEWSCYPHHVNKHEIEIIDSLVESRWLYPDRPLPYGCPAAVKPLDGGKSKTITPHGLEAWGYRTGGIKPKIDLWEGLPIEEYVNRCIEDVKNNIKVFFALMEEMAEMFDVDSKDWREVRKKAEFVIGYERLFAYDIYLQATYGIQFDQELAQNLVVELDNLMASMDEEWKEKMPLIPIPASRLKSDYKFPAKAFKKDGTETASLFNFLEKHNATYDKETKAITLNGKTFLPPWPEYIETMERMTFTSRGIPQWLVDNLGWDPLFWNYKVDPNTGRKLRDENKQLIPLSPKIKDPASGRICPNLLALDAPFAQAVVKYGTLSHRRKTILGKDEDSGTGFLNNPRLEIDGKLSADMVTSGASTRRCQHRGVANIPKADEKVLYGKELRSLFCAREGKILIGYDAAALEARIEAALAFEYDYGEYKDLILSTDIHQVTADKFGITRNQAKTLRYSIAFGAQAANVSKTLNCSLGQAKLFLEEWWSFHWATKKVIDDLQQEWKASGNKWITSVDGSKLYVRAAHSILNTKIQGAGAAIMKVAACFMHKWTYELRQQNKANKVIDYHDEAAWEVDQDLITWKEVSSEEEGKALIKHGYSDVTKINGKLYVAYCEVGKLGVKSIIKAGEILKLPVPMDSVYKVGASWAQIH